MIIETTANELYQVTECVNAGLSHCWEGYSVKRRAHKDGGFVLTAEGKRSYNAARPTLVRKAGCKVIAS